MVSPLGSDLVLAIDWDVGARVLKVCAGFIPYKVSEALHPVFEGRSHINSTPKWIRWR